jgi:hypothetical protein
MFKQSVVRTEDGGTSYSSLHNAPFVLEPGLTKGLEPNRSSDLNITGCNDRDSLSNGCFGSDQLGTSCSALSGTPLSKSPIGDVSILKESEFLSSLSMLQLLSMCAERGLSSDNLKKDELLKQLIIYNQSKSPKSTSPIAEETRWWSDPNGAGWINLTLSQLHLVKYEELKNHLYNRGHLITVIEHLHVYEPEAI